MSFSEKLVAKMMAQPEVQRQLVMGLIDNFTQNIEKAAQDVIDGGEDVDKFEVRIHDLLEAVSRAHALLVEDLVHKTIPEV